MPVYRLGNGDNFFDSLSVSDWINGSQVYGGNGDDTITARGYAPTLAGNLLVSGGNGDDTLLLDAGNSTALGGNGDDLLISFGGGSGMGRGNTLSGGPGQDTFRFTNSGNLVVTQDAGGDRVVSDGDVFLGPTDVITDYGPREFIQLRTYGGPEDVPPPVRIEDVALIPDPLSATYFRPVVGDGEYALFRGDFAGEGVFTVASGGDDTLVVYDAFGGGDNDIAQGSLVLLGVTDPGSVLIG